MMCEFSKAFKFSLLKTNTASDMELHDQFAFVHNKITLITTLIS